MNIEKCLVLKDKQGKPVTTSRIIADIFGKKHEHVLRDIRDLQCSKEFQSSNFGLLVEMKELPQGGASKTQYYEITKDGFSFLVMGYKGAKAGRFKEDFIRAFNQMENLLNSDDYIEYRFLQIVKKKIQKLEQELHQKQELIDDQSNKIKNLSPKAEYTDSVLNSTNTYTSTQMSKELGLKHANHLHTELKARGIMFKQSNQWMLRSKYSSEGYTQGRTFLYLDNNTQEQKTNTFTVWTERGRRFLHSIFD